MYAEYVLYDLTLTSPLKKETESTQFPSCCRGRNVDNPELVGIDSQ